MAEVKWIKIVTDIFDDEKMLLIESLPSADSIIVIWFKLLCLAGKNNNNGVFIMSDKIAYTDEMLATIFRRDVNTVRLALKTFEAYGMIEIIDGVITIPNWGKHQTLDSYEKKKERDRIYQNERRKKQREIAEKSSDTSFDKSSDVAISDKDIEEDKEKDIDKKTNNAQNDLKKSEANALFEKLWKLYPVKRGKGQVSDTAKLRLLKIGEQELLRAMKRYNTDLDKDSEWRKPQNGSTFFNSGYVDYLDDNYVPSENPKKKSYSGISERLAEETERNINSRNEDGDSDFY